MSPKPTALLVMTGEAGMRPRLSPEGRLADVFRATCLLHLYKGHRVTWITGPRAASLLEENHLIDDLRVADVPADVADLAGGRFETVINLEKTVAWAQWTGELDAERRFGFVLEGGRTALADASRVLLRGDQPTDAARPLQQILYEIVAETWMGQPYLLGRRPTNPIAADVGFCHRRGEAWPTQTWPGHHWRQLGDLLGADLRISTQPETGGPLAGPEGPLGGLGGLPALVSWLNSCVLLIGHDGLALHLALALGKRVIGLFGPTPPEQVYLYGQGVKLTAPVLRDCSPCRSGRCLWGRSCMGQIEPKVVAEHVCQLLPTSVVGLAPGFVR